MPACIFNYPNSIIYTYDFYFELGKQVLTNELWLCWFLSDSAKILYRRNKLCAIRSNENLFLKCIIYKYIENCFR